jgi:predicted ATPase
MGNTNLGGKDVVSNSSVYEFKNFILKHLDWEMQSHADIGCYIGENGVCSMTCNLILNSQFICED